MTDEVQPLIKEAQEPEAPTLTLSDLALMATTIQVVTTRGAIKADEMAVVGELYNKLTKFLNASGVNTTEKPKEQ